MQNLEPSESEIKLLSMFTKYTYQEQNNEILEKQLEKAVECKNFNECLSLINKKKTLVTVIKNIPLKMCVKPYYNQFIIIPQFITNFRLIDSDTEEPVIFETVDETIIKKKCKIYIQNEENYKYYGMIKNYEKYLVDVYLTSQIMSADFESYKHVFV